MIMRNAESILIRRLFLKNTANKIKYYRCMKNNKKYTTIQNSETGNELQQIQLNKEMALNGNIKDVLRMNKMEWPSRTHYCGKINEGDIGKEIRVCGWVDSPRNHGSVLFIDIRDHTGIIQIVIDIDSDEEIKKIAEKLRNEYVVCVMGQLRMRKDPNPKLKTGTIEIVAVDIKILNTIERLLPFNISENEETLSKSTTSSENLREEVKLKERLLDLRREKMNKNLHLRHEVIKTMRRYLEDKHGFIEIETPILTKATPEGARDYLVPSRTQKGNWYALPQSPQLFKQMLMVAGFDKYYQIARCFRDEDLRADRQPEFTQLDMEMSFMDREAIMSLTEDMFKNLFEKIKGKTLDTPFPKMTYTEAMLKYGTDRPDIRYEYCFYDITSVASNTNFKIFQDALKNDKAIKIMKIKDGDRISNSRLKIKGDIHKLAVSMGSKGLVFFRIKSGTDGEIDAPKALKENLSETDFQNIIKEANGGKSNDLFIIIVDDIEIVNKSLNAIRRHLVYEFNEIDTSKEAFLWIIDFPMFEYNNELNKLEAVHHPFTAPNLKNNENLNENTKALAYDLVYNGIEIGGGSLRIYKREIQEKIFEILKIEKNDVNKKFGFLLDALDSGAPPHGGIAFGLDRLAMLLCGADSIRDVIAFPKTTQANCLLTGAPAEVEEYQLEDLGVCNVLENENC